MSLGPLPYEVIDVKYTDSETVNGYYVYSEIAELYGGDGLYGIAVIVCDDSLSSKLRRVLSFRGQIPDSIIVKEFRETTRDGLNIAVDIERELRDDAKRFMAREL